MKIHTVLEGEDLRDIAEKYSVSVESIRKNNGLKGLSPARGEQLLILTPTRSYTAKTGDTPERIALRFGLKKSELIANNPDLSAEFSAGDSVILKYGERTHGMAASLGYIFDGYSEERLRAVLPFMTYGALGAAVFDGVQIKKIFNTGEVIKLLYSAGKIPLLRVYFKIKDAINVNTAAGNLLKELKEYRENGFKGIVISGISGMAANEKRELIGTLKKELLGKDMILICEEEANVLPSVPTTADGVVISSSPYSAKKTADIKEDDYYRCIKELGDGAKCFVELPSFTREDYANNGFYIPTAKVYDIIRRKGKHLTPSSDGYGLCSADGTKERYTLPSLEYIKAKLESINELGLMGIAFDTTRCPISYLMMYNSFYKTI